LIFYKILILSNFKEKIFIFFYRYFKPILRITENLYVNFATSLEINT